MSDKNRLSGYYQAALFTAVMGIIVLAIASITFSTQYKNSLEDIAQLEERIESERDSYYAEMFARPRCKDDEARIEYLEGQLLSCTSVYMEERHNRQYYQNALDNFSSYCSDGLNQLVIDGLRGELETCKSALDDAIDLHQEEKLGAPCHKHYDGIHCGWDLRGCAFDEFDWLDRQLCDNLGIASCNVAWALCSDDKNCSNCLAMSEGNVERCLKYAYYPK